MILFRKQPDERARSQRITSVIQQIDGLPLRDEIQLQFAMVMKVEPQIRVDKAPERSVALGR